MHIVFFLTVTAGFLLFYYFFYSSIFVSVFCFIYSFSGLRLLTCGEKQRTIWPSSTGPVATVHWPGTSCGSTAQCSTRITSVLLQHSITST